MNDKHAHIPTPEPPQNPPPKPGPDEPPEKQPPIDDPGRDPRVKDPPPDEKPNPRRYRGPIMSPGRTHSSYCASLT